MCYLSGTAMVLHVSSGIAWKVDAQVGVTLRQGGGNAFGKA